MRGERREFCFCGAVPAGHGHAGLGPSTVARIRSAVGFQPDMTEIKTEGGRDVSGYDVVLGAEGGVGGSVPDDLDHGDIALGHGFANPLIAKA